LKNVVLTEFLPRIKIHEFYQVDEESIADKLRSAIAGKATENSNYHFGSEDFKQNESKIVIVQDLEYRRLKSTVDFDQMVLTYNVSM
jgi:hypothetical protein